MEKESGLGMLADLNVQFEHVAVAAPSLRYLVPIYVDLLGGRPIWASDNMEYGFRVVWIEYSDGSWHELMEPLAGSDFFDKFFSKRPMGGLHHITFLVSDIDKARNLCLAKGFEIRGYNDSDEIWKEFFLDLADSLGTLIQIGQSAITVNQSWTMEQILSGAHGNGVPSPSI
jgi:methylmalonyl-CoA/ethylmalonyl-CoA epimerase